MKCPFTLLHMLKDTTLPACAIETLHYVAGIF